MHDGLALDTGFLVHNERNYPLLDAPLPRARRRGRRIRDVVLGQLPRLRARVRRPAAVRAGSERGERRASTGSCGRSGAGCAPPARSLDEQDLRRAGRSARYLDERGYSQRFRRHFLVPLTSALWSTAPARALEFPAALRDPLLRQPRDARLRPLPLAHASWAGAGRTSTRSLERLGRRFATRPRRCAASGATSDGVLSCGRTTARRTDSIASSSRPTPTRRSRCSRTRADEERRLLGAFAYTPNDAVLHTDASLPAPRARPPARPGTTGSNGAARPTVTYYLNRLQRLDAETRLPA